MLTNHNRLLWLSYNSQAILTYVHYNRKYIAWYSLLIMTTQPFCGSFGNCAWVYRPSEMVVMVHVPSYRCNEVDIRPGEWVEPSVGSEQHSNPISSTKTCWSRPAKCTGTQLGQCWRLQSWRLCLFLRLYVEKTSRAFVWAVLGFLATIWAHSL